MSRDDLEEYIRDEMAGGIEVTAEDFEGRDCAHCGETIPFTEFPDGVVTWDIRVHEPDEPEPEPYYHRYYFCSEDCKSDAAHEGGSDVEPDVIHVDDLDDERLIADGGTEQESAGALQPETEIEDGVGRTVWPDAHSLDAYEYDLGDKFVRWAPWGDERAGDDVYAVTNIEWRFKTTWITDRDNPTTTADHRVYVLTSRETFDEHRVPESELKRGDWKLLEEAESDD